MSDYKFSHSKRYGDWAGCPGGHPEDMSKCTQEVFGGVGMGFAGIGRQCHRKRGYGLEGRFCKQHAKIPKNMSRDDK